MKDYTMKFLNAVMAGVFIGLGAVTCLLVPNRMVGNLFFATGIFLVVNFQNMLFTRVVPLAALDGSFSVPDCAVTYFGNLVGTLLCALGISGTRLAPSLAEKVRAVALPKLADGFGNLFLMGVFCALLVGYAVLCCGRYERGSFGQIFYVWLFITAFVFCGFDHIVANFFYFSFYSLQFGVSSAMLAPTLAVTLGNVAGGEFVGFVERVKNQRKEKPAYQQEDAA